MTDNITALIARAQEDVRLWGENGYGRNGIVADLAAALKAEHQRAESARTTGERILADALRYRAAIEEALPNRMTTEHLIEEARNWNQGETTGVFDLLERLADALEAREEAHTPTNDERARVLSILADMDYNDGGMMRWSSGRPTVQAEKAADRIVRELAGFRRTEVPLAPVAASPRCGCSCHTTPGVNHIAPKPPLTANRFEVPERSLDEAFQARDWDTVRRLQDERPQPQGEPSSEVPEPSAIASEREKFPVECDKCGGTGHVMKADEPQGEPSDAQVRAAWEAYITAQEADPYDREGRMRAALRAAAEAGGVR